MSDITELRIKIQKNVQVLGMKVKEQKFGMEIDYQKKIFISAKGFAGLF
mgnify:CR=1 FL=1